MPFPSPLGLSESEASSRFQQDGPNELPSAKPRSNLRIAAEALREPMFLLLVVTGVIYLLLGGFEEAVALLVAIGVVIGITVYQQRRTERTLEALRDLSSPRALVIRDGERKRIAGRDVVRGDALVLAEGDRVPADAFVLSNINLAVDESLLTGESAPAGKETWDGTSQAPRPGGDNSPAVYSGTLMVQGSGLAEVFATGGNTEIGKLGRSLQSIGFETTDIERETRRLVRLFAAASVALCLIVAIVYGLTRHDWLQGILAGLALAISMVPEEFPVVLTVFMALGAWRISKKRVLTRRLTAIETLGAATVLCVDKTGTLTMNRMSVGEVWTPDVGKESEVLAAAAFASADDPVDPMERALREAAANAGGQKVAQAATLAREYPLSKRLLAMTRVIDHGGGDGYSVYAKGAPEAMTRLCRLSDDTLSTVMASAETMAARGLRVLGVAAARFSKPPFPDSQHDFQFAFLGLVGLEDPVRPSAPAAISECYAAGIRVLMITGDYPLTAESIARQVGLPDPGKSVTGSEIADMTDADLRERVKQVNVFARVLPEQKLRLVEALKANGDVVAMTGDGVNDAPALKAAHIGIAMGGRGTDVAREAASLVLLDDDFSSIVEAIRLGRRIYDNLRKAMTYVFAIHLPIAGMSLAPVLLGLPLVLMPLHIVFLELIIDPACSLAFESEPEHPEIMKRRPRDPQARLFDRKTIVFALFQGFGILLVTLGAYAISLYRGQDAQAARAISFTTLIVGNLTLIWANRSRTRIIPELLRSPNKPLWAVTIGTVTLLAITLYVPWFRNLFQFSTLHPNDIVVCLILGLSSVTLFEMTKWRNRKHNP